VLLALGTAALYLPGLENAPLYLIRDEVFFGLTAQSIARTFHDPYGVFLPLYFETPFIKHGNPMWFHPILMYAIAGALKVLAFSERTIRLPMVVAGIVNVLLIHRAGRLLFGRELFAVTAAVLLALTPTHFMFSRVAMDYQVPVPFVLGWLVAVLTYLRRNDPRFLFVAGLLLGFGLYSYVAATAIMPMYGLLTCVVMFVRRERARGYGMLAAGFLLPALLAAIFLVRHPTMVRDIVGRYQPDEIAEPTSTSGTMKALIAPTRIVEAATLYASFWNPRFLFVDGPLRSAETTWLVGVFLMPIAGLLLVGLVRLVRQLNEPNAILVLGGALSAPIPASFAGQPEAIRRALEIVPFAVLIAVFGLVHIWTTTKNLTRWLGFVLVWAIAAALAVWGHDALPYAQAFVRAATVPLAIAALAFAIDGFPLERMASKEVIGPAIVMLPVIQVIYYLGRPWLVDVLLAAAFAVCVVLKRDADAHRSRRATSLGVLVALVAGEMTFHYIDYPVRRIGMIPASALVFALRAAAGFLVVLISTRVASGFRPRVGLAAVIAAQVTYFFIDVSATPSLRLAHVAVVMALAIVAAVACIVDRPSDGRAGPLLAASLAGFVCLQFGVFYADYFNRFQARGSGWAEGNTRLALEYVIDATRGRPVPAIYVARVRNEFGGLGRVYGHFYALKHHREDLIPGIEEGVTYSGFEPERLRQLPAGSIIIVNPSRKGDAILDQWEAAGEVTRKALLRTPDGTLMFRVFER